MQTKVPSHLVQNFEKWTSLCQLNALCFYILQSHHLLGELTYYSVFLPIFYILCR